MKYGGSLRKIPEIHNEEGPSCFQGDEDEVGLFKMTEPAYSQRVQPLPQTTRSLNFEKIVAALKTKEH